MDSKELVKLIAVIRETSIADFKNLSSMNCGSAHKSKDEIVSQVCNYAHDAMNLQNRLHQACESIQEGYTFDEWLDSALKNSNRTNQPSQDREKSMAELQRVVELMVTL